MGSELLARIPIALLKRPWFKRKLRTIELRTLNGSVSVTLPENQVQRSYVELPVISMGADAVTCRVKGEKKTFCMSFDPKKVTVRRR